ncbi:MAG TPA: TetR/AcrR family transcriptional regulator [Nevskiaceae bacterium]|nr:TetR/AcrR family transcriptional regulator [Nevskiaceae bacterium]
MFESNDESGRDGGDAPKGRQAAKSEAARKKILDAIVGLIKEGGYGNATASRIAERSGLTWGAVQHHFGDKEQVVGAVTNLAHEKMKVRMADPKLRTGSLADRASMFVDRMWEHYQDDVLLATLEILLATRGFHEQTPEHWADRYKREHTATMREIFRDAKLTDAKLAELLDFIHCVLTGLTVERVFQRAPRNASRHLQRLKVSVLGTLLGPA